ncbi:hypothetical protein CLAFUR0_11929 [Fulvia fulva]|nr:hypothetical protein CLAFUR0_11929 [Fulvia fulva]
MSEAAATAVFGTAELLEAILLNTSNKTLVVSQHTCKTFKASVDSSAKLQRKLFLRHEVAGPGEARPTLIEYADLINPLMLRGSKRSPSLRDPRGPNFQIVLHKVAMGGLRVRPVEYAMTLAVKISFTTGKVEPAIADGGSWRRMYIGRQGVLASTFTVLIDGEEIVWFTINRRAKKLQQRKEGITLGEIFEMALVHAQTLVGFEKVSGQDGVERWTAVSRKSAWPRQLEEDTREARLM